MSYIEGRKKISKSKTKKDPYFGPDVQSAIQEFLDESREDRRNEIFDERVSPAFHKLVESLIYVYKFIQANECVEDVKTECVSYLYESLRKFDPSRGTKAFSYFNVVARNWLIVHSKKEKKNKTSLVSLDQFQNLSKRDRSAIVYHSVVESPDEAMSSVQLRAEIREVLCDVKKRLTDPKEVCCMQAIITIYDSVDEIDILHKRAVFFYIRDISGLNSKEVSSSLSNIRRHYREVAREHRK